MKQIVKKGATGRIEYIFVLDSSKTDGSGLTGLSYNTTGLTAYYVRAGSGSTAITLANQTVTGAYTSGGFVEVDATNMPGVYRFDVPNAVFASGSDKAIVMLKGAANMAPVVLEYQLVDFDPENPASLGLSNLDAAVSSRSSHSAADVWSQSSRTITGGSIDTNNDKAGYALADNSSDAVIADAVWNAALTNYGVAGSYGEKLEALDTSNLDVAVSSRSSHSAADVWSVGTRTVTGGTIDTVANDVNINMGQTLPASPTSNTVGAALKDADSNLDAAVSSRSSHTAADVWAVATRTITGGSVDSVVGDVNLNMDQALPSTPTANTTGAALKDADTNLDATVSSRSTFDPAADTVIVGTNNDKTGYELSAAGVDAIWDENIVAAHGTADTSGYLLSMLTARAVTLSSAVHLDSVFGQLFDNGTAWSYDRGTDSLEALAGGGAATDWTSTEKEQIRHRLGIDGTATAPTTNTPHLGSTYGDLDALAAHGDSAWATATGFSTHSPADVWAVATRKITGGTIDVVNDKTGYALADASSDAVIADAVWNAALANYGVAGSYGEKLEGLDTSNLDVAVSSRSSHSPSDVWGVTTRTITGGTIDTVTNDVNINMSQALPTTPTANTTGAALKDADANLDATVSSRSSHTEADVWAYTTRTITGGSVDTVVGDVSLDMGQALPGAPTANTVGAALKDADTNLDATVSSRSTFDPTTDTVVLADSSSDAVIADAVWNALTANYGVAGSYGEKLEGLGGGGAADWTSTEREQIRYRLGIDGTATAPSTNTPKLGSTYGDLDALASHGDSAWATATGFSTHSPADVWAYGTRTLTASLDPTAAQIADAVWDELQSGHVAAGTFGAYLDAAISSRSTFDPSVDTVVLADTSSDAVIADAVWNAAITSYGVAGSYGEKLEGLDTSKLDVAVSSRSSHSEADVWAYTTRTLTSSLDPTAAQIADAVWDEARAGHTGAGTFGEGVASVQGNVTGSVAVVTALGVQAKADVNAEVLDVIQVDTLVAGVSVAEALRRIGAVAAGKVSGAGTGTETVTDWAGSANTIVVTVDSNGNRTAVVFN